MLAGTFLLGALLLFGASVAFRGARTTTAPPTVPSAPPAPLDTGDGTDASALPKAVTDEPDTSTQRPRTIRGKGANAVHLPRNGRGRGVEMPYRLDDAPEVR